MAGAFSSHLIDQFNPNSSFNSSIVSHGAMSFSPNMHGTPLAQQSFSLFGSQASFGLGMGNDSISEETQRKIATLQLKLNQKLGPEFISQRPGPGGGPKLTYVEGWKIINLANEVFGFNGWSSSIVSLTTDFADYNEESRKYNVGVTALIRVTLRDGVFHEDIGYGMLENSRSKGAALDKCKKEAVTDGLKRALRNFGNVMGNCLYDKSYAQEVIKIKFEPTKLNKDSLHRRPEFEDVKPVIPTSNSSSNAVASSSSTTSTTRPSYANGNTSMNASTSRPMQQPTSIQNDPKGKAPVHSMNTPAVTPAPAPRPPAAAAQSRPPAPVSAQSRPPVPAPAPQNRAPLPQPPQPNRAAQQQPPHQPPKPNPALELDDSSHFFDSDDDAFLATADLGPAFSAEADMGRPIDGETDMGQPINHEEGLMPGPEELEDQAEAEDVKPVLVQQQPPPLRSSSSGAKSRHELIAAALSGSSSTNDAGTTTSGASTSDPRAPVQGGGSWSSIASGPVSGSGPSSSGMRPPPLPNSNGGSVTAQVNGRATSLVQQNHQRYMALRQEQMQQQQQNGGIQNQNQNQNQNPAQNNPHSSNASSNRSSVGGFNFPPGMNPLVSNNNANIPSFDSRSSVGVKRPADAMTVGSGRPSINVTGLQPGANKGPGGGFQGGMSGSGSGSGRSVLGALEVTEGGDVKRRRS